MGRGLTAHYFFTFEGAPERRIVQLDVKQRRVNVLHKAAVKHAFQVDELVDVRYRGSSGVFFERYAVVVPQKMFVMYSQAASYPVHALSLAEATPLHDAASRTVALQVAGRRFTFRGSTEQDALEWLHVQHYPASEGLSSDMENPMNSLAEYLPEARSSRALHLPGKGSTVWDRHEQGLMDMGTPAMPSEDSTAKPPGNLTDPGHSPWQTVSTEAAWAPLTAEEDEAHSAAEAHQHEVEQAMPLWTRVAHQSG
ncbi:hypothetical protein WJX81_005590 [Elliptochloris bilobata]|uniref:PH domain-containing protein n=1 Tax=Elliptochloris bilobata TaxID=381761 RepID=A0AAW1RSK7_9CHLO